MSLTLNVTECMSSLDIHVSLKPEAIKILKLCVFLIVIFLLGLLHLDFNTRSCGMKKQSVPYTSHFSIHSMQAMAICSRNSFSCLNKLTVEYQECLKAGPFDVHYQCISAWWHCDCLTRMRCVDTFR